MGRTPEQAEAEGRVFYVTVLDAKRRGFLLGPYDTHQEARAHVGRGRDLACASNLQAHFYGYGTCSAPRSLVINTVFN
jgi:hypothetical protein